MSLVHHVAVAAGGVSGDAIAGILAAGAVGLERLGGLYLHLLAERFGTEGRMVDKTIDASRFLGLIAAVLPEAPLDLDAPRSARLAPGRASAPSSSTASRGAMT